MSPTSSPIITGEPQVWLERGMETLWLLAVFLVPLIFLDWGYAKSEAIIGYLEVPKIALQSALISQLHRGIN